MSRKSLTKTPANRAASQQTALFEQTAVYHGPIPPPDMLQRFDDVVPGSARQILEDAHNEGEHRRNLQKSTTDANIASQKHQLQIAARQSEIVYRTDLLGQILGAGISLVCIGSSVYLAVESHYWIAAILGGIPSAALIRSFFFDRKK